MSWQFTTIRAANCRGSVPGALIAFLEADDFEHAIRLAISLGGDADTQAAVTGAVAEAFWGGVPERIEAEVRDVVDSDLRGVVDRFYELNARRGSAPGSGSPLEKPASKNRP